MEIIKILAWIIITIVSLFIAPLFTITVIFIGAKMPILALISVVCGILNMIRRLANIIKK